MKSWNELSMAEKADVMKLAIDGGVYDLDAIRSGYNEFAEGGPKYKKSEQAYYDKNTDTIYAPDSIGEFYRHEMFHARPDSAELERLKPYYENLNDNRLLELGADLPFVKGMDNDPGHFYSPEEIGARVSAAKYMLNNAGINKVDNAFLEKARKNENAYGDNFRDLLHMYNNENLIGIFGNGYSSGGKIHIKPENRGKFTALKERTGHSTTWFKEHGTPAQKKMATFAINAAKWKHDDGGKLFSGEEESSQQMQLGRNYWINQDAYPEWGSSTTIDGGALPEIVVTPTNDAAWLFSIGKYQHNPRKPLADKHTRKVVSNYLSKFDNESAKDYNARISRLADVLDIRGVQFKKNDVKSGKLKGRAHYIDQSATAYIDNMEDIFAEVAHPWQYAKGNNNIEREVGTGKYDSDSDPRGGTRYAYPDTAEGETHAFFEPVLTEWIETGKIGKSSPILNNELSRQKIKPKDRMEVGDSASSWDRQAIERRLLANPDQLPLHKRIQYSLFDYPLLDKKKAFGGNLFYPGGEITYGQPYYSYDENGKKIDDTLNYNAVLPEIIITPDSKKSPAERAVLERERRRNHDAYYGRGTYNAKVDREQTELEKIASQKAWENSIEKQALDYAQAAASGIGIGADIVSGLPIYSSLKGARVLSEAETPMDYAEGALWLAPIAGVAGREAWNVGKQTFGRINTTLKAKPPVLNTETPEAFQSNLDWSADNWFKDISGRSSYSQEEAAELASFVPEYHQIEERLIKDGTLIFDNNGSLVVRGSNMTPQEYIMRQSKEFQKMNPEHHYVGVSKGKRRLFEEGEDSDFDSWTTRTSPKDVEEYAYSLKGGYTTDSQIEQLQHEMLIREDNHALHQEQLKWKLDHGKISQEAYNRDLRDMEDMYTWKQGEAQQELDALMKQKQTDPLNGGKVYDITYPRSVKEAPVIDAQGAHWQHVLYNNNSNPITTSTDNIVSANKGLGYDVTHIDNVMDTFDGTLLNESIIHRGVPVKSVLGNTGKFATEGPNKYKRFRALAPWFIGPSALSVGYTLSPEYNYYSR